MHSECHQLSGGALLANLISVVCSSSSLTFHPDEPPSPRVGGKGCESPRVESTTRAEYAQRLGDEAVTDAWFGDEVLRSTWLCFEFASDLGEVDTQVVGFALIVGAPDLLE